MIRPVSLGAATAALLMATACWGFATAMTKGALEDVPPYTLLSLQLTASVGFLWAAVAVTRQRVQWGATARRAALAGLLEPGLAYGVGVPGLALTSAANATVIAAAEPAVIALLAALVLRQRPGLSLVVALGVALVGVALVALADLGGLGHGDARGNALVLLGTVFAGLYVIVSSQSVTEIPALVLAALQQTLGLGFALSLLAGATLLGLEHPPQAIGLESVLLAATSGIVQYALGFWFYLIGMRGLPVTVAGSFLALIPVFGLLGAVVFLGERVSPTQLLGAACVIGAVLAIARGNGAQTLELH